ncbi:MAG: thiamine pyrophosphate-requiring protein [Proteobacteria bacterium]|nr:thiamine pyrophosphate-requiring protein [Pseudomonadota bacterium]
MDGTNTGTKSVAEAYLQALADRGIKYVFANGGTDFAPVIEGLSRSNESGGRAPEFMVVPHENVAVAMANGYYEVTEQMAAVMVHVTVGTANALCGLMNASRENVPMLLAAGRTPITETGHPASRNGSIHWGQESFDQGGMVREYVKWDYELRARQPVDTIVGRALDVAMSAPRGPVYMTLPREVLAGDVVDTGPGPRERELGNLPAAPSGDAIEKAADMIAAAENVLIVAGQPGQSRAGWQALSALAENHAIAVTQPTRPNLPASHPMNLSMPTAQNLEWADVVLVIDAPVPWMPSQAAPQSNAKIIHMATDPNFSRLPHRGYESDLLIAGDAALGMRMLNDALSTKLKGKSKAVDKRRAAIKEMRDALDAHRAKRIEETKSAFPIHPVWAAHCLNEVKNRDAVVMNELGVPAPFLKMEEPNCSTGGGGAGGLGRGLGAALGAKLGAPEKQVIAAVGDGSYMFGVPIAAHFVGRSQSLPTLTMVSNNAVWLAVRGSTLSVYPEGSASKANAMPVTELTPSPDFEKAIESCGGYGEKVENPDDLIPALERSLQHVQDGTQALLNVAMQPARG